MTREGRGNPKKFPREKNENEMIFLPLPIDACEPVRGFIGVARFEDHASLYAYIKTRSVMTGIVIARPPKSIGNRGELW